MIPTPLTLYILIALAHQPSHGYALTNRIATLSRSRLIPQQRVVYLALKRMLSSGLVSKEGLGSTTIFRISPRGLDILHREQTRLRDILADLQTAI